MENKEKVDHLTRLKQKKSTSPQEKKALAEAIKLISNPSSKFDYLKALDILIKLIGIGSNLFHK